MNTLRMTLAAGLLLGLHARAEQAAFQGWLVAGIDQKLGQEAVVGVTEESRFEASYGNLYRRLDVIPQVTWKGWDHVDLFVGYKQGRVWNEVGDQAIGHSALFGGTLKQAFPDWLLSSRQRFEFGDCEGNALRYFRQLSQVEYRGEWVPWKLRPFLADEWILNLREGGICENRLRAGVRYSVDAHFEIETFLMRFDSWNLQDDHKFTPVAGLALNLHF